MWWAGNWNSNAVFKLKYDFPKGKHTIIVYGAEGCCDGNMDIRIKRDDGPWTPLRPDTIDNVIPPYP